MAKVARCISCSFVHDHWMVNSNTVKFPVEILPPKNSWPSEQNKILMEIMATLRENPGLKVKLLVGYIHAKSHDQLKGAFRE